MNVWMNELPPKFHLEGSEISRCLVTNRVEEFQLSSLSEAKDSVESQKDEKMRNEWEGNDAALLLATRPGRSHKTQYYPRVGKWECVTVRTVQQHFQLLLDSIIFM